MRDDDAILSFRPPEPTLETLERFLAGEGTTDEVAQVRAWAGHVGAAGVSPADDLKIAIAAYVGAETSDIARTQQILRERLGLARIPIQESLTRSRDSGTREARRPPLGKRVSGLKSQILRQGLWAAGMMILVTGLLFLVRRVPAAGNDVTRVYATAAQQQAVIDLTDGTRVTLAPQTTLRLQHFGQQSRTVVLENGEAYFEVTHTTGRPFVVHSGTATSQVLGTAFLVRYHAGDSHVHVAVIDGKVRITSVLHTSTGLTLTAGQIGDVADSTLRMSSADDLAPSAEWESGRVVFRHMSVEAVLQALSQWYGYQFRYKDQSLGSQSVTMVVSTRSSAEALATIEKLLAVNLTIVGDTITLVPHAPQSTQRVPRVRSYDVWTPTKEVGR